MDKIDPDVMVKLRARYGNNYKIGWMHYKAKGETL
jgi:Zn-finger domain-containing protein